MSQHLDGKDERYDVIIVGSGLGGLTSAAILSKTGKKVLVLEKHTKVGGCAHSFKRKNYWFDSSVHSIGGCGYGQLKESGLIKDILDFLNLHDRIKLEKIDPFYRAFFPDRTFRFPTGMENYSAYLTDNFPMQKKSIVKFMDLLRRLAEIIRRLPEIIPLHRMITMPFVHPLIVKYYTKSLRQVLDAFFEDEKLKAAIASLWPYAGVVPEKLSFCYWVMMMITYIDEGAYYAEGGFQTIATALADSIRENGGEILLGHTVQKILVENDKIAGVMLENGRTITAPVVIANADIKQTVNALVGRNSFPRKFIRYIDALKPSLSATILYLAVHDTSPLSGLGYENFLYDSWDFTERSSSGSARSGISHVEISYPSLVDTTVAPPGENLLFISSYQSYDAYSDWENGKDEMQEKILKRLEAKFKGIRDGVSFMEGATPRTIEKYTSNFQGAAFGRENSVRQFNGRIGTQSPIPGLFFCGHWISYGGGVYAVMLCGLYTAREVLGEHACGDYDFLRSISLLESVGNR